MRLYRLSEPLDGHTYVIVSAVTLPTAGYVPFVDSFVHGENAAEETYIFACDEAGKITQWGELKGSFKGAKDHARALRNAGYEVLPPS